MNPIAAPPPTAKAAAARGAGLFGCWLLAGPGWADPAALPAADAAVGLAAAGAATWVSLRLLPPSARRLCLTALARLAGRLLGQSVIAGIDVARRVFDPRLPLRPGYLSYPVRLPPGPARAAFGALTSLVPGTLPVGTDADGALIYHCLDLGQPVAAGLARDEALLCRALGGTPDHD